MKPRYEYRECIAHCAFDRLPEGLEAKYAKYIPDDGSELISRSFLQDLFDKHQVPADAGAWIRQGLQAIEEDSVLLHFTKFLVSDMSTVRNRTDDTYYVSMTPSCLSERADMYSFLLLLACVEPSMAELRRRGIPESAYRDAPDRFLKPQLERIIANRDAKVRDFPWEMNFYTCAIYLFDRFFFIPQRFEDAFTMFRRRGGTEVVALRHAGETFRRDGQRDGINGVFDPERFETTWSEDDERIVAHRINPTGFVEREPIELAKREWETVLRKGDALLALHIPSGPGYTPERLKSSMRLAVHFYATYFPELPIRGFWSESWLYDPRLSLVLDAETSNIVKVQRQFYNYPINEGDGMLRHELFGDRNADPSNAELKSSLQKAAASYMRSGRRFNTVSMVVLKEEIDLMGTMPYLSNEDIERFQTTVDSHLAGREGDGL